MAVVYPDSIRFEANLGPHGMFDPAIFDPAIFDVASQGTDIAEDALTAFDLEYGITSGNGPLDSIAGTGQCSFTLRNDASGARPIGWYSPGNASVRSGWTFGIPFVLRIVYLGVAYTRFTGKIQSILPDTGIHGQRQVQVVAYDVMRDLAEADLLEIGVQISQTESQIISNVLSALPSSIQPVATDIDPGVDTFPYALDDLGPGTKALSVIADLAHSSFSLVAVKGDGTFIVRSRHTRSSGAMSTFTFISDFIDLIVPSDLSGVFNLVRVTSHPKTIDAAATTVLYSLVGTVPVVAPGETLTLWGSYNDPTNAQRLVGGTSMVTSLVPYPSANYDYAGNAAIDGSGSDLTGSLSIVATAFASTVKFDVTNTGTIPVYLVAPSTIVPMLRIRGKGVYDRGPQTFQSSSVQSYGVRPLDIDMPYQNDPNVAQAAAEYIQEQYNNFALQMQQLTFIANQSHEKMLLALTCEPGDIITVTEPVTGLSSVIACIQSVALSVTEKVMTCTLGLAPANTFLFWEWGIVGRSEWGLTTVYGF